MELYSDKINYGLLSTNSDDANVQQALEAMAEAIYNSYCRMSKTAYLVMQETIHGEANRTFELEIVGKYPTGIAMYKKNAVSDFVCGQLFETVCRQQISVRHMHIDQKSLSINVRIAVIMYGDKLDGEWQASPASADAVACTLYHYYNFLSSLYPGWEIGVIGGPRVTAVPIKGVK